MAKRVGNDRRLAAEAQAVAADAEDRREAARVRSLMGSIGFLVSDEELIEPLFEDWEPDLPREDEP
jgi:hypothetical protein